MTYKASVEFKFDSTQTPRSDSTYTAIPADIPEQHFLISAPAHDLSCEQYFKLFERFLLCVGMDAASIRRGAMSLVFTDWVHMDDQRSIAEEYDLTLNEDLESKYQIFKETEAEVARIEGLKNGILTDEEWQRIDNLVELDSKRKPED